MHAPTSAGPVNPGVAGSVTLRANLERLLDGDGGEDFPLQNGDSVFVPKPTSVFVLGDVQSQVSARWRRRPRRSKR